MPGKMIRKKQDVEVKAMPRISKRVLRGMSNKALVQMTEINGATASFKFPYFQELNRRGKKK